MERLMKDASSIKNLLPWITSEENIVNFMRKIPLDKSHLRNKLTLLYFLKTRDYRSGDFEKVIEEDARQIVIVMPDTPYNEIREKLYTLGNLPNRKEVVLRQLLYKKHDLDTVLKEINVATVKKRKSEACNEVFGVDSNGNHANINIKIRRVDGSLEVVPTISNEEKPSSASKNLTVATKQIEEPTTSSTSVTSSTSTNQLSNSLPDSPVPSTTTEADDPCPEFTAILNGLIESNLKPSTSGSVIPTRSSTVPSDYTNKALANACDVIKPIEFEDLPNAFEENPIPNPTPPPIVNSTVDNGDKTEMEPKFNLIDFIKELSVASEYKIYKLCKSMGLNLKEKPSEGKLNSLLNRLLDDEVVKVESADSNESDSDTEEYNFMDALPAMIPISKVMRKDNVKNAAAQASIPKPNTKEFKLRAPVLTSRRSVPAAPIILDAHKPIDKINTRTLRSSRPAPFIRPPRFNPAHPRENIVPAMPNRFLDALKDRFPDDDDEPLLFVDDQLFADSDKALPKPPEQVERMIIDQDNRNLNMALNLTTNENNVTVKKNNKRALETNVAGPSNDGVQKKKVLDQNLVLRLIEIFPAACPEYIRKICDGKRWTDLDDIVTVILSTPDYPRRPERVPSPAKEVDPEEQFEIIKELLPDADPTYLRMQCESFAGDEKGLKQFINVAMEMKDYPTMKEYLRKQQLSAQQKQYTTEFDIENFIQLFPEPEKTFKDPKRNIKIESYSVHYLNAYFKNRYDKISARIIQQVLIQKNFKVLSCDKIFMDMIKKKDVMKCKRKHTPLPENLENIPLLQELAYLSHKEEIKTHLLQKQKWEKQERLDAKKNSLMETCNCCYDEEVMPKDTYNCPNGCKFCKECIKKSCEVALGEGKTDFPCLADCSAEFTLQTLQGVLPPKMFSKLAQKKALAEIKAAGIEELETCPFCDFATIPNEADKIFRCLNPDCMKESCRKCKEPNHVPLKCEEVEKDQDVEARTYIENKMTEALLRKCWKCGTSFFKEEGCNKMTCSCGAQMCYICKKPVTDYSHFNGIGGDKFNLCPLYSDTNFINQQNVLGAAAAAKAQIDPSKLKMDPTVGITDHFKDRARKLPREPHLEVLQQANQHLGHPHHRRHRHHNAPFGAHQMHVNDHRGIHNPFNQVVRDRRHLEMQLRRYRQNQQQDDMRLMLQQIFRVLHRAP